MRGDFHSRENLRSEQSVLRDSSSGSSSPHSNASHEDEVVEVNPTSFMPKPIYNFSIPDVIRHDHRVERENRRVEREARRRNNCDGCLLSGRKRSHSGRATNTEITDTPTNTHLKKRKRNIGATNYDEDCHQQASVVIDLTDIDSHDDEQQNAHSDSEVNTFTRTETRPLRHFNSFRDCLSNLQRFHQRLQSNDQFQRLRRRRPSIITDGPVVTDAMIIRSPEIIDASTPELGSADDSVTFLNEVRHNRPQPEDSDHSVALRMVNDPNYSPPYHTPPNASIRQSLRVYDESFRDFQERIRAFRRERYVQARRISLARIHESLNDLRSRNTEAADNERNGVEHETIDPRDEHADPSSNVDNNSSSEVEFIREWNPRRLGLTVALDNIMQSRRASLRSGNERGQGNSLPHLFMESLFQSPLQHIEPEPRLHHLHDYEALLHLADRLGEGKRGLSKTELEDVPSFRFSKETSKATNLKCVICMSEYAHREKLRRLPCSHDFHAKCIDKWLKSNITCPICRDEVNPKKKNERNDEKKD